MKEVNILQILFDDIIFSLQRAGGISTYWRNLTERIIAMPDCSVARIPEPSANEDGKDNTIGRIPRPMLYLSRYLPVWHRGNEKVIFHSSYYRNTTNKKACQVTTVHDFVYERYVRGAARIVHSAQKRSAVRSSEGIICISKSTEQDLRADFPRLDAKVRVVYLGVSPVYRHIESTNLEQLKPAILFIGKRGGYKNFDALLNAFHLLKHDYALTIVGGEPMQSAESETIDRIVGTGNWRHLSRLSDEEVNEIYNRSFCLVYPSKYEGFGLPVAEAMRAGCPVVCGTNSSLKEAGGDAAFFIDSETGEAIADAVRRIESSDLESVRKAGFQHASKFTWDSCAKNIYDFYRELWDG